MKSPFSTPESRERERAWLELDTLMFKHGCKTEAINERCRERFQCALEDADATQCRALADEIEERSLVRVRGLRAFTSTANAVTNSWEGDAEK